MNNILFIQADKFGQSDFLFVDSKRILDKDEIIERISEGLLIKDKLEFTFSKNKHPFTEVIKKFPKGLLLKGQLNEEDSGGRITNFTCFYIGKPRELNTYIDSCLTQIGKSYNKKSLIFIEKSILKLKVIQTIFYTIAALSIGTLVFKLYNN